MKKTRPYKDRPWLIFHKPEWWENIFLGLCGRLEVDTSHPEWIKQVLIPMIEKCKKYKIVNP